MSTYYSLYEYACKQPVPVTGSSWTNSLLDEEKY